MNTQFILDRHTDLSVQQIQALTALLAGATNSEAAERAGVHRSTIYEWRENDSAFRAAYIDAKHFLMASELDRLQKLSSIALDNVEKAMTDPETPRATALRASLAVLTRLKGTEIQGWALSHLDQELHYRNGEHHRLAADSAAVRKLAHAQQNPTESDEISNFERPQPIRVTKVGRNQPCPCQSGRKYKQCCLNKPRATAA